MPNKTLITEAAIATLVGAGFKVAQSLYIGGFGNLDTVAIGIFAAGLVALVQRYRMKKEAK
jgi:hypothetical protein